MTDPAANPGAAGNFANPVPDPTTPAIVTPVEPAAATVAVTDDKGPKILATGGFVDEFRIPGEGDKGADLVITPAGVEVPAGKVKNVLFLAERSGVELREVAT